MKTEKEIRSRIRLDKSFMKNIKKSYSDYSLGAWTGWIDALKWVLE